MLASIFRSLQAPRNRKAVGMLIVVLALVSVSASAVSLGWSGILLTLPCLALGGGAVVLALAAIRVSGDPTGPLVIGWRSGWFDLDYGRESTRNLVMARGWQDSEGTLIDSPIDAQVATLLTEVQYLREALALHGVAKADAGLEPLAPPRRAADKPTATWEGSGQPPGE